jgi:glycosyltransferase involved in cell wall biosynthesis
MPKVSVIIPCYNQGQFLSESIGSVQAQTFGDVETVVVNDGSTDENTLLCLEKLPKDIRVVHTTNQGLAAARNNGIEAARGEYILPLDADDRIGSAYVEEALQAFGAIPDAGIVYCKANFFGKARGPWKLPPARMPDLLLRSSIFCTALFRRRDWELAGGYNRNMLHGWEDWDFWLSLIELGRSVYQIPRVHFYYRIWDKSMVRAIDEEKRAKLHYQLFLNHQELYLKHMKDILAELHRLDKSISEKLTSEIPTRILRQTASTIGDSLGRLFS